MQKRGGRAVLSARPGSFPEHARDLHSHSHALGFTVSKHNPRLTGERLQPVAGGGSNLRSVLQTLPAAPSGAGLHRPCSGSVFCSAGRATLCRGSPAIPSRLRAAPGAGPGPRHTLQCKGRPKCTWVQLHASLPHL